MRRVGTAVNNRAAEEHSDFPFLGVDAGPDAGTQ
jgi:hypothetical protein